jgi:hypothetical protein
MAMGLSTERRRKKMEGRRNNVGHERSFAVVRGNRSNVDSCVGMPRE